MNKTNIEWSDVTWNPLAGCSKVSPGCANRYAEAMASRLVAIGNGLDAQGKAKGKLGYYEHVVTDGRWNGKIVTIPEALQEPLKWKKSCRVFVNSMTDLFHENVEFETIYKIFEVMLLTPQHTYQILTKRASRLVKIMRDVYFHLGHKYLDMKFPLPNVWLGVSVEDQQRADERILLLLQTSASVRFLSCEPLLGSIDLQQIDYTKHLKEFMHQACDGAASINTQAYLSCLTGEWFDGWDKGNSGKTIPLVVVGAESGRGARPMQEQWARDIKNQCVAAGVPFFYKQNAVKGKKRPLPILDGQRWLGMPEAYNGKPFI